MKENSIFVAGIPSGSCSKEIERFFESLGFQVEILCDDQASKSDLIILKGHCVMQAKNPESYSEVLNSNRIVFKGRSLTCKPFLSGKALQHHNRQTNKRRVVIKSVPLHISMEHLRNFMESAFGPIDKMYQYLPEKFDEYRKILTHERKFGSYSVLFYNEKDANLAVKVKKCLIGAIEIDIEAFNVHKKYRDCSQTSSVEPSAGDPNTPSSMRRTLGGNLKKLITLDDLPSSFTFKETMGFANTNQNLWVTESRNQKFRSESAPCKRQQVHSGMRKFKFLQLVCDLSHRVKPTSRAYRVLRGDFPQYFAAFELKNCWTARSNTRLNLSHY